MANARWLLLGVLGLLRAVQAHAEPIALSEVDRHRTEATAIVNATPSQVYALLTDYAQWPSLLGDVRAVTVERGGRDDARVRFRSKVFGSDVTVQFHNVPDHAIRFEGVKGPPGARASGEYLLEPLAGGRTRVVGSLYLDVVGLPGVFVSAAMLRAMRDAKLRADMSDVLARLARDVRDQGLGSP